MNLEEEEITPELQEMFDYLDAIRKSGVTNMWRGGHLLSQTFDVSRPTGRAVLRRWMDQYSPQK